MASCNILNGYSTIDIGMALISYTRDGNEDKFIDRFINKQGIPKSVKYKLDTLDNTDEVQKAIKDFNKSMDDAITSLLARKLGSAETFNNLKSKVLETLHVDLDEHTSGSTPEGDSEIEEKTTFEIQDNNQLNLEEHFKDIYGTGAYNIISQLKEQFSDNLCAVTFFNAVDGTPVLQDNITLNTNIQALKNKYFKTISSFLKSVDSKYENLPESMTNEDGFIGGKYYYTLQAFYDYLKRQPNYQQTLDQLSSKQLNDYDKKNKTIQYEKVVSKLLENNQFNKTITNIYRSGKQQDNLKNTLYIADHLSPYYLNVKRLATKYNLLDTKIDNTTVGELLDSFESESNNLLNAANAYTSLVHFDSMLIDTLGDAIEIKQGEKGLEFGDKDKYSHKQETAHQKKSWQQGESIQSEKFTSNLVKAFLSQIRILNYKTDQFQNRRADITSVIVAARNLIDDVVYGKINLTQLAGSSQARQQAVNEFALAITDLHENPEAQLQKVLSLLFEVVPGTQSRLIDNLYLTSNNLTSEYDLSTLYSLYQAVLNTNNPNSLKSQEIKNNSQISGPIKILSSEIAGIVDRNTTMHYLETSYDGETGMVQVRVKKRYFNNASVYKNRVRINRNINNSSASETERRVSKWQFTTINDVNGNIVYSFNLGNTQINYESKQILNQDGKYQDKSVFNNIAKLDLTHFRQKILRGEQLTETETNLKNLLEFIDDHLGLKILENPNQGLQQLEIFSQLNPDNLMNLTTLAIKAAYVNNLYNNANKENKSLQNYLKDSNVDGVYQIYSNNPKSKLFTNMFNNLKITIASYNDTVLENWGDAYSIMTGEASKSTTKNKANDNIPNNSINKLGTNIHHYLYKQMDTNTDSLYFVHNSDKIKGIQHDLEATSQWQESKQVKGFSQGELFFHSIFNKFWGNYLSTGNFIIQPTAYSDKTTFIQYEIASKLFGNKSVVNDPNLESTIVKQTINTIGTTYKNIWKSTQDKLQLITNTYNSLHNTNYTIQQMLANINEPQLVQLAKQAGVDVTLDADYRKAGKHLAVNETLQYYAEELYTDPVALTNFLREQKKLFIQNFLQNNCTYQVIDYNDSVENYYGQKLPEQKSNNPIMQTILGLFKNDSVGRIAFFKNWVDAKTGKLILAKQDGRNLISNTDVDFNENIEVNPLLDKFFYIEGFLSNNMRMSLTGSEINHPDKAKQTLFKQMQEAKTFVDANKLGIKCNEEQFIELQNYLKGLNSVGDIKYIQPPVSVAYFVDDIYHKSLTNIINTAQGTQFKRNVIIPATLQYCLPKTINGIAPKVKCAVIRDEGASVYNYRGDHEEDIDSADGSAQINPFQSILENMALGSQAVGFIKKPIWHAYDPVTGTAFLAKFATDTITNETMRASLNSHTNLYNLFKKMTNLQWNGDVDLLQSIALGNLDESKVVALNRWWNNVMLGNTDTNKENNLYYKNKYGEQIQITGFSKTVTQEGNTLYYTNEAPIINGMAGIAHKVYHIFYDTPNERSKHITFDSWQKAQAFLLDNSDASITNKHTINSLFELHSALGGINCVDSKGNYSEFSNLVVVNFMNAIGHLKEGADRNASLNQDNYIQPLKQYHIGYALNNTAVKNGAQNVNQNNAWYDDTDLNYFEVDSDGLGMQMNADHDIIDSELTEFSQVITATSAYGFTYNNTDEIFQGLGRASLSTTRKMQKSVDEFISNFDNPKEAQSNLYDAIGRIVMKSASIKDQESLQNIIMQAVQQVFYKSKDHQQDSTKIPFSDPNVYSDFIATLASTINKEAIKRKHPGSGCVMVPAYHMIQYFELGGEKLMATDLVNRANQDYKESLINILKSHQDYNAETNAVGDFFINGQSIKSLEQQIDKLKLENPYKIDIEDSTEYNKVLLQNYLAKKQNEVQTQPDKGWFMPSDNVDIIGEDGSVHTYELTSMDSYYKFKDGINDIEIANNVSIDVDYKEGTYTITSPTAKLNLVSQDGIWYADNSELSAIAAQIVGQVTLPDGSVVNGEKVQYNHQYRENITRPHDLRPSLIRWQDSKTGEYMNIFDSPVIRNAYTNPKSVTKQHQANVQVELNLIQQGQYTDRNGNIRSIKQDSLQNYAAELIMSNIYKEKFGIGDESLAEVLKQGEDYFYKKFSRVNAPANTSYDLAFVKDTGNTTLISLSPIKNNDYIQYKGFEATQLSTNEKDEIYLTKGNQDLFEVGKWIDVKDVIYKDGEFIKDGVVLDSSKYRLKDPSNSTTVQYKVEYVKQYVETSKFVNKGRIIYKTNTLYEIAPIQDFVQALGDMDSAQGQRAKIIAKIYRVDNYKLAQLNNNKVFSDNKLKDIKAATGWFLSNTFIDQSAKDLLKAQLNTITSTENKKNSTELQTIIKQNKANYNQLLQAYLKKEAHKRYISFLDSQNFIAARIPAQSLQSFMTMKNIAWTENSKNISYVSHFQTYLQGSDYKHYLIIM